MLHRAVGYPVVELHAAAALRAGTQHHGMLLQLFSQAAQRCLAFIMQAEAAAVAVAMVVSSSLEEVAAAVAAAATAAEVAAVAAEDAAEAAAAPRAAQRCAPARCNCADTRHLRICKCMPLCAIVALCSARALQQIAQRSDLYLQETQHMQVIVEPHRHEGIFIARGKEDALVTRNMVPGESVYGEKRVSIEVRAHQARSVQFAYSAFCQVAQPTVVTCQALHEVR